MNNWKLLTALGLNLSLLAGMSSCIDEKYDLDKLSKDAYFSPNGISVGLGNVDTLWLKSYLKVDEVGGLEFDENGYFVEYHESLDAEVPTLSDFLIEPVSVSIRENLIAADINAEISQGWRNARFSVKENGVSDSFSISLDDIEVEDLSVDVKSVIMESCEMKFVAKLSGVVQFTETELEVIITLPEGFTCPEANAANEVTLRYNVSDCIDAPVEKTLNITEYTFPAGGESTPIKYNVFLNGLSDNATLITSSNPTVDIDVSVAPQLKTAYGTISGNIAIRGGFDMSSLSETFTDSNDRFVFYNPSFKIEATSNLGVPFSTNLSMWAVKGDQPIAGSREEEENILLPKPLLGETLTTKYNLARMDENDGFIFRPFSINNVINRLPDSVITELVITPQIGSGDHFIDLTKELELYMNYTVRVPFAFADGMQVSLSDTISGVFSDDMVEYLFPDKDGAGDFIFSATAEITIPLDLKVQVIILDENNQEINGINIASIELPYSSQSNDRKFEFKIVNDNFKYMEHAKNMAFRFSISSNAGSEGRYLKPEHYIFLKRLVFRKTGGIHFQF